LRVGGCWYCEGGPENKDSGQEQSCRACHLTSFEMEDSRCNWPDGGSVGKMRIFRRGLLVEDVSVR
jgi:hypothetical protein